MNRCTYYSIVLFDYCRYCYDATISDESAIINDKYCRYNYYEMKMPF